MKILVTGGAGFVGNHLAHKLKELGHDVIINDFGLMYRTKRSITSNTHDDQ